MSHCMRVCNYYHVVRRIIMADKFKSMTELMEQTSEGDDWEVQAEDRSSNAIITAIHGGGIEPGTTELAALTAAKGNFDFYSFKGTRSKGNQDLHVTSTHYDEPTIKDKIKSKDIAVAIHGCDGDGEVVYLGGKDEELIATIKEALEDIGVTVDTAPDHISGDKDKNINNCGKSGQGVQLELTPSLRKSFFKDGKYGKSSREDEENWDEYLHQFADALVKAVNARG